MIGISRKVEDAVVSVLSAQTGLESVAVIQGKDAHTHAFFPRVVVECSKPSPIFPNMATPLKTELEITVQTDTKVDTTGDCCGDIADVVCSVLQPPNGVTLVDSAFTEGSLDKLELKAVTGLDQAEDHFEYTIQTEIYLQS